MRRLTSISTLALFCIWFLWVGISGLDRLGLYCDETIFINAALGGRDGDFIYGRILGIPTYIMPYIGALKSWIHAPIFWAFGVDPWSIRVPGILISLGTILLFAELVRRHFGSIWALATLLLLCTDPGFLLTSRTDYGPTVLMGFMKAMALFAFFWWLEKPSAMRMLLWLAALVLGIWNKLDFLWILIAFGAAALSLHGKEILQTCRAQGRRAWVPLMVFGLALLAFLAGPIRQTLSAPPMASGPTGWDRWVHIWGLLRQTFDGRGMTGFQFPDLPHPGSSVLLLPLAGLLAFPLLLRRRSRQRGMYRWPLFFLLCSFLIFWQAILTPQAGGAHHLLLLWPFPQLFAISIFVGLQKSLARPYGRVVTIAFSLLFVFVVGTQVRVELRYLDLLSKPELISAKWSPRIYDLVHELESRDVDVIVSTDWGLHPQLSSLASTENRPKYIELWPMMKTMDGDLSRAEYLRELLSGKRALVLLHAERTEEQAPSRRNTLFFLDAYFPERRVKRIEDAAGRPLYEIHIINGA